VPVGTRVIEVVMTMQSTKGRPGAALIVERDQKLAGIFTDGDLRRAFAKGSPQMELAVDGFMGRNPKTIRPEAFVDDAERLLREHKIDQIAVVDGDGRAVGLLDVQDLLDTRVG
jgi:arabinose-5-phosphate isomerase